MLGLIVLGGSVYFAVRQKTNTGRTYPETSTAASHATPQSTTAASENFSAVPSSGSSPLSVMFTGSARGSYTLNFGDGTPPFSLEVLYQCSDGGDCVPPPQAVNEAYTYAHAGIYAATLNDDVGTQTVTVVVR